MTAAMLLVERASVEAVATLRGAGVRSILVKGPLQQDWLAPSGMRHASVDVDLIVDPVDLEVADEALSAAGYTYEPEVTPGVEHHCHRWTSGSRLPIEVHWTLWGTDPARTWRALADTTEWRDVLGERVEIPSEPARCLIVALHAAHHGAGVGTPIDDLESAVAVAPLSSWQDAAALASAVGGSTEFAAGLGLVPSGERLRAELGVPAPELTQRLALNLSGPVAGAAGFFWLERQRGWRAKVRFVARKLVPPPAFMRFKYELARRGRVSLAVAYLYRLVWIAGRAVPALLSWQRVRRKAGASDRTSE